MNKRIPLSLSLALALNFSACTSYKAPLYQGNLYAQAQIDQLKVGMPQAQVKRLLGSPTLQDPFHKSRWDYYSLIEKTGEPTQQSHLIVEFDAQGLLKSWGLEGTPHQ
jgi:outer membrane protein assembly factor BamE